MNHRSIQVQITKCLLGSWILAYQFTPEDIFWSQLAGCLEAIDGGTTTVVDFSHLNYSPKHCEFLPAFLVVILELMAFYSPCWYQSYNQLRNTFRILLYPNSHIQNTESIGTGHEPIPALGDGHV